MNGTRARKRTEKTSKLNEQNPVLSGDMNGKVKGNINSNVVATKKTEKSENVFLFYPNIIGMEIKPAS